MKSVTTPIEFLEAASNEREKIQIYEQINYILCVALYLCECVRVSVSVGFSPVSMEFCSEYGLESR